MSGEPLPACLPCSCKRRSLEEKKRRSDEWRNAGCLPRFLPQAAFGLLTPRSRRSFILLFFPPPLGSDLPLYRTNAVCIYRPSWPGLHPRVISPSARAWSIPDRAVDCLAIAKCRTLQHLPRCCPLPPIRDTGPMRKSKVRESTRPALTRTTSLLALMDREL